MSSFIPIELQTNILSKLPVKTLVRFTAVCKSWYSMIKNPDIFKPYHNLFSSSPEQEGRALIIPLHLTNDGENICAVLSQDSFHVHEKFRISPLSNKSSTVTVVSRGYCNGVICLSVPEEEHCYWNELYLYNPSIRKLKTPPSSSIEARLENSGMKVIRYIGFGYDQITDDYKVVRIYRSFKGMWFDFGENEDDIKLEAEIYSLRSDSWKTVELNENLYCEGHSVSVNNATHWLSYLDIYTPHSIVAFDFGSEKFREIAIPVCGGYGWSSLVSYKGSLALLEIDEIEVDDSEESEEELERMTAIYLWIMKQYGVENSWSMELTGVINTPIKAIVNFTKNGKLIFWKNKHELASWDPETEKVVDLVEYLDEEYIVIEDYSESLVLI